MAEIPAYAGRDKTMQAVIVDSSKQTQIDALPTSAGTIQNVTSAE
ncbi:MAG TPA: hypothetical protein VI603_03325 [Saprospiraceae bacterium]|nr:hypothetical protein [Saprospiraceae bacterium]